MAVRFTTSLDGITADDLGGGFWVGWPSPPTPEPHLATLHGAEVAVLAIDAASGTVVGYVTAVGDGVLTAYIPLLEVLPAWQRRGIGSGLVRRVIAALEPRYMIDVVCDEDVVSFYERLGFSAHRAMIRRDRTAITDPKRREILTAGGMISRDDRGLTHQTTGGSMTRDDVQRWLDAYVDAWRTYDAEAIGALFSEDVSYAYQPYDAPVTGRAALVADWLASLDAPGSWEAHYEPFAVDGDRAVSVGTSRYLRPDGSERDLYHNVFLLRFDRDGRCTEFVEYWRERPSETEGS